MNDLRLKFNNLDSIVAGVDKLEAAVGCTMGPGGRLVVIEGSGNSIPGVTKDGVTATRGVVLSDPIENLASNFVREASFKTLLAAGDGTTSAIVLAKALLSDCIAQGIAPVEDAVNRVLKEIEEMTVDATPELLRSVALVSSNGDEEIADEILKLSSQSKGSMILQERVKANGISSEHVNGYVVGRGFAERRAYINDYKKMNCTLESPTIVIIDQDVRQFGDIIEFVSKHVAASKPFIIFCRSVHEGAMASVELNAKKRELRLLCGRDRSFER